MFVETARQDLAVLKTMDDARVPSVQMSDAEPKLGQRVVALTVSAEGTFSVHVGSVTGVEGMVRMQGLQDAVDGRAFIEPNLGPGSSGSPVLDQQGKLIGIVEGGGDKESVLIPSATIRSIIRQVEPNA